MRGRVVERRERTAVAGSGIRREHTGGRVVRVGRVHDTRYVRSLRLYPDPPPARQNGVRNWLTTLVAAPRSSPEIAAATGAGSGGSKCISRTVGGGAAITTRAPK